MDHRILEITLQSARDLSNVNLITKMDVYAVVSISGGDKASKQKTKTPADRDGGSDPTWNFAMKFAVDEAALQANRLTLDFKLVCERALGDKDVGDVSVPIKELLDSRAKAAGDGRQIVSYQVRKPSGKPKGQLSFWYKFCEETGFAASAPPYAAAVPIGKTGFEPITAYPAGSSSGYPPPGSYPNPPQYGYPIIDGSSHYPPPAPAPVAYPAVHCGGNYPVVDNVPKPGGYPPPPPPAGYGYPIIDGSSHYPPPAPVAYPAVHCGGNYPVVDSFPKPGGYPPPPPPAGYGYPPPPAEYGYVQPPRGYGYPAPPQSGYGYAPPPMQQQPKKNKFGMGLGAGLLGGALGGLLIGDAISDMGDSDFGGFDF